MSLEIENLPIEKLKFDPTNARKHSHANLAAIRKSLNQFGQRKPIVISANNVIVAGNGTVEAARSLGWKSVECVRVPEDWTDDEVIAFALADNRTGELAEWNEDILAKQLLALEEIGFDITAIGFDVTAEKADVFEPVDDVPRLDQKNKTICPECGHQF